MADFGSLMYLSGDGERLRSFVWVDPEGDATEPVSMPKQNHLVDPNISPSGDRLVFALSEGGSQNIFTWDLNRRVRSRITNADRTETWHRFGHPTVRAYSLAPKKVT